MTCPGCRAATSPLSLAGQYGRVLAIDVCHACNGLWFDGHEDLHLAPGGVIALVRSDGPGGARGAHGDGGQTEAVFAELNRGGGATPSIDLVEAGVSLFADVLKTLRP